MYLPGELARGLAAAQLVSAEQVLFQAQPAPAAGGAARRSGRASSPSGLAWDCCSSAWGGPDGGRAGRASRSASLTALWGLVVGFIGCFLVYAWVFTDHVVAHRNQNILLCAPWAIALVVLGVGVAIGRPGATRKAFALAAAALGAVLLACRAEGRHRRAPGERRADRVLRARLAGADGGAAAASLRYSIRNVQTLRWLVSGTPTSSG